MKKNFLHCVIKGTLKKRDGSVIKGNFKETDVFYEKPLVECTDEMDPNELPEELHQPPTLIKLAIEGLAAGMHKSKDVIPAAKVQAKLNDHWKLPVAQAFMKSLRPKGTDAFMQEGPYVGFRKQENIFFRDIKLKFSDVEALMYLICANKEATTLQLTSNKLDFPSLDLVNKSLAAKTWPKLETLDLSFNSMDITSLKSLFLSLENNPNLLRLRLAGCKINVAGAAVVAAYLASPKQHLRELNLSFNSVLATGTNTIAGVLRKNTSLIELNLRHNSIGIAGGESLCDAMEFNRHIRVMVVCDNKVGSDVIALLAARLKGTTGDVALSVRTKELNLPIRYKEMKKRGEFGAKKSVVVEEEEDLVSVEEEEEEEEEEGEGGGEGGRGVGNDNQNDS